MNTLFIFVLITVVLSILAFIAGTFEGKRAMAIAQKKVLTPAEEAAQKVYDAAHVDAQARVNVLVATANKAGIKVDPIVIPTLKLPK